jgi:UDP-N-acetylmuramoylalanine--D-glutamate ligase
MDIRGKTFSVLGAARSGLAVAALLHARGAEVFVSDSGTPEKFREAEERLRALGIASEFGRNSLRVLDAETIVVSPGVPSGTEVVRRATAMGKSVVSEIEVAGWFCPAPIVAVTGTNGKTTTTALLGRMFEDAKRPALVGGNIGTAFSDIVGGLSSSMTAILEISSFQLDHIHCIEMQGL